ncbi:MULTISPECIES: bifunctional diguanylate cyclase/phosphodiesterase [unclassified Janthinobacterium]|uniref:bifunctional diguanylate cyclase/phosphodiesterase n=1 Tax=unclassified Janthinobacterium TaxID=2610881 RepID=UPI0003462112|nr:MULTISPECIES: EAL domain-containing protein [unclassified Janthinobacterium]MEC5162400.1 diguanylate cyclase (GGDEF)-like protein/PAS domain S-box-containing protein [Janthinobacterium sp. CG_S6]
MSTSDSKHDIVPVPHEAAELFRLMAEEIEECAIFLMDPHGVITTWNRAAEVMKGYLAHEAVGQYLGILYTPEDVARDRPAHNLREAAKHGYYREETWRKKKDGSLFFAHIALTALRDDGGQLLGFSKVTLDLTPHKMLEQCLDEKEETQRIMEAAKAGTWKWQVGNGHIEFSPAFLGMLGYQEHEPGQQDDAWAKLVHPDDAPGWGAQLAAVRQQCPALPLACELRLRRKDGAWRWFYMRADWRWNERDRAFLLMGVNVDIHDRKLLSQEREALALQIQTERNRFAAILDQMPVSVVLAEVPGGAVLYQNHVSQRLFGTPPLALPSYRDYAQFQLADADGRPLPAHEHPLARAIAQDAPASAEQVLARQADGALAHFSVSAAPVHDDDGVARVAVSVMHDIEAQTRLRKLLEAEKERAQVTLKAITNGVVTTDLDGLVDSMNAAAERMTGWSEAQARGQAVGAVVELRDADGAAAPDDPIALCLRDNRAVSSPGHALLLARGGRRYSVEHASAPLHLANGRPDGAVLVLHDVTEARGLLDSLSHQATHDALTGLVNRREFSVRLQRALDRNKETAEKNSALLYMDLDQFKIINDTCGHGAGDELLRQLAYAYGQHVRERDTLARIGGDEFALIVEHCTEAEAMRVADKLLETTRAFRYVCKERSFQLGVSIGLIPIDGVADSVEEALRLADHACYIAKESGRNRVFIQKSGDVEMVQRRNDMYWTTRVGDAFRANQLELFYQPIEALGGAARGLHYEILLRMKNGSAGPILPGTFLPSAERYDIMPSIDRWVLDHSLAWLEQHPQHVAELELCSINLSQRTLADPAFRQYAVARIGSSSLPPQKLCFEITETGAAANLHKTLSFINELKALGCSFALDDFGTGMASFAYLKQLPVDYVKIDGSFIQAMGRSQVDFEMVRFTNEISHLMGRRTIAEFVSNQDTLQQLKAIGVDFAQGFLLGKPRPLAPAPRA